MVSDRCHGGRWRIVAAAVGYLILPVTGETAEAEHRSPIPERRQAVQSKPDRDADHDQYPGQKPFWLLEIEAGEKASAADCSDPEKCRSEQRDYSDLRAQWKAALAAEGQRALARAQTWIAGGATLIAGIGTWFLVTTFKETRRSADAADESNKITRAAHLADQRPWLAVSYEPAAPVKWTENGCNFQVRLFMQNVGKSPAIHADIRIEVVWAINVGDYVRRQIKLADDLRESGPSPMGRTIFPNDRAPAIHSITISHQQLAEDLEFSKMVFKLERGVIHPMFIGVVDYYSAFEPIQNHQTAFIFTVLRRVEDGELSWGFSQENGDMPIDKIVLRRWVQDGRTY